jgi:ketosteroid isomerase-like protein
MDMSIEKDILELEERRIAAMTAQEFGALEPLVHDELLYTHSNGLTDTKASWMQSMTSGRVKYKSAACSERKVRVFGDVALISGKASFQVEANGQPRTLKLVFLNAWTRTPRGWKFVAWQSCPQPA